MELGEGECPTLLVDIGHHCGIIHSNQNLVACQKDVHSVIETTFSSRQVQDQVNDICRFPNWAPPTLVEGVGTNGDIHFEGADRDTDC